MKTFKEWIELYERVKFSPSQCFQQVSLNPEDFLSLIESYRDLVERQVMIQNNAKQAARIESLETQIVVLEGRR